MKRKKAHLTTYLPGKKQSNRFKRPVKIIRKDEIYLLYKYGKQWECPLLKIFYLGNSLNRTRCGIIVSKETGNAVIRNRIKRTIREFFRKETLLSSLNIDVLVRYLPRHRKASDEELEGILKNGTRV
jgi:ribonuclease P protein component